MIKEDFCSPEVAKLLNKNGFDEEISTYYLIHSNGFTEFFHKKDEFPDPEDVWIKCPTHQMAMKWLREKGIYITIVYGDYPSLNKVFWTPQIDSLEGFDLPDSFYEEYDKYENTIEAALKYVLENLI